MRTPGLRAPGPEESSGPPGRRRRPSGPEETDLVNQIRPCPATRQGPAKRCADCVLGAPTPGLGRRPRPGWCERPGVASSAEFEARTVVPAGGPEMTASRCFIPEPAVDPAAAGTRSRAGRERGHQASRVMAPLDGPCPAPSPLG